MRRAKLSRTDTRELVMIRIGSQCLLAPIMGIVLCLGIGTQKGAAQETELAGEYVCAEAHIASKTVPCKSAPLTLSSDGKFELQGREGEYMVNGGWVELKGRIFRSRAKLEAGHKIVFRFHNKYGVCEMIFERRVAELGKTELS
jgi:hypothetical protein